MRLKLYEYDMKLKYPFSISRHTYYSQPTIIIELKLDGISGYGEATANPYYNISTENLKDTFIKMDQRLRGYSFYTPDQLYDDFSDFLEINSFALGALNNASWDLYGKLNTVNVSTLIKLQKQKEPQTSYTLGIDTKEGFTMKLSELPWPIYKVKLGTKDDLGIIKHIRSHTKSILRVDANCAWDLDRTLQYSREFNKLGVEFIEQPLPAGHSDQIQCYQKSKLPIMADESCRIEADVEKCLNKFHGINIKLLKCGGLSPALQMIKKARKQGLKIMVGCMTESTVGIAAAAQLLSYVDYVDLDGPLILAEDVAAGITYEYGKIKVSEQLGLGIHFFGKR